MTLFYVFEAELFSVAGVAIPLGAGLFGWWLVIAWLAPAICYQL